jgi:hypothetical protein
VAQAVRAPALQVQSPKFKPQAHQNKTQKATESKYWQGDGETGTPTHCWWNVKWSLCGKQFGGFWRHWAGCPVNVKQLKWRNEELLPYLKLHSWLNSWIRTQVRLWKLSFNCLLIYWKKLLSHSLWKPKFTWEVKEIFSLICCFSNLDCSK